MTRFVKNLFLSSLTVLVLIFITGCKNSTSNSASSSSSSAKTSKAAHSSEKKTKKSDQLNDNFEDTSQKSSSSSATTTSKAEQSADKGFDKETMTYENDDVKIVIKDLAITDDTEPNDYDDTETNKGIQVHYDITNKKSDAQSLSMMIYTIQPYQNNGTTTDELTTDVFPAHENSDSSMDLNSGATLTDLYETYSLKDTTSLVEFKFDTFSNDQVAFSFDPTTGEIK